MCKILIYHGHINRAFTVAYKDFHLMLRIAGDPLGVKGLRKSFRLGWLKKFKK